MSETIRDWIWSTLKDDEDLQDILVASPGVYYRNSAPDNLNASLTASNCYITFFLVTDTPLPDDGYACGENSLASNLLFVCRGFRCLGE